MANVTRGIAWVIVGLEALWATFWLITMIYVQASTDDTNHGMDYRYAIIINALHAVSPIALIGVMNEHHRYSPMAALFFVFAIMTDLWSLLDAVLHLNRTDNYDAWRICLSIAGWSFALAVITLSWYVLAVLVFKGQPSEFVKEKEQQQQHIKSIPLASRSTIW